MKNLKMFLCLAVLTGVLYPLLITGIAQLTMKPKADGGIIVLDGKPVGARLIGQPFQSDKYFWPRPSTINYNPLPSGGSNLSPTSKALKQAVDERLKKFNNDPSTPSEMLFASGSGLDPDIRLNTAYLQADRIAKARGIDRSLVLKLIDEYSTPFYMRLFGPPSINVLLLNLELDKRYGPKRR